MTRRHAFTLTELLVTIGIIVILISLLIPVVGRVRSSAMAADSKQLVSSLQAAIERYHMDFKAYPGPLANGKIYAASGVTSTAANWDAARITGAENLTLGLLGGLANTATTGNPPAIVFNPDLVGQGPRSLNPANPKTHPAYIERANLSEGIFRDDADTAEDTPIPEFVDRFTNPLPVLYLRATSGRGRDTGSGVSAANNDIITTGSAGRWGNYQLEQVIAYTGQDIGIGREGGMTHGLRAVTLAATLDAEPFDAYPYFRDPATGQARQKDRYILISAGQDRVYGTRDDIVSFGSVGQ